MKKAMVFVVAFIIGIGIAVGAASLVNDHTIYVHQYVFDNGVKITIDYTTYIEYYDDVWGWTREYFGCINYGTEAKFIYSSNWPEILRGYAENHDDYLTMKSEWRW